MLIIDKEPEKREISVNTSVIAVHKPAKPEWYRTGMVMNTSASMVSVRFDDGHFGWVSLQELRLVKRPRLCQAKHLIQGLQRLLKLAAGFIIVPTYSERHPRNVATIILPVLSLLLC